MSQKSYEMRVKILEIGELQQISDTFKKRDLIGVIEGEYPEHFKFEFIQGKADVPVDFLEGTYVNISFNIRGKKVEAKKKGDPNMYFTTLSGWQIVA